MSYSKGDNIWNAWPDQIVETLKELWRDGNSCSQIARAINTQYGTTYSRSSIIGKVHRLGLAGRATTKASTRDRTVKLPKMKPTTPEPPPPEEPDLSEHAVTNEALDKRHCRWPIGDPLTEHFRFCGRDRKDVDKPKAPWMPYCEGHMHKQRQRPGARATAEDMRKAIEADRNQARAFGGRPG